MSTAEVVTFGEAMISLRAESLIRLGCGFTSSMAGAESNVAVGLARLGHHVVWTGAAGQDEPGALIIRTLRAEGVDAHTRLDPARPTGLMLLEHRLGTTSRVTYHRAGSAGGNLGWSDVEPHLQEGVRLLHFSGITPALGPRALEASLRAIDAARDRGIAISLDINHRKMLWSRETAAEVLAPMALRVDHLIASDAELQLLGGGSEDENTEIALSAGVGHVVVKRGAAGVTVVAPGERLDVAARSVAVVDTIGAGDAFTAGYLSAVLEGNTLRERAQRGVDVAAFAVASTGDWEGLPTREELALLHISEGETLR
ncbi:MAG: sugar kinase [Propionibacteriaceae bacterium]|nr:sugar kinase [Propionibacteriaceae bacterium]